MRKILAAVIFAGLASSANAAIQQVNCGVIDINNGDLPITSASGVLSGLHSCPAFDNTLGAYIGVSVSVTSSVTSVGVPPGPFDVTFTYIGGASFIPPGAVIVPVTSPASLVSGPIMTSLTAGSGDVGFDIGLDLLVISGSIGTASSSLVANYEYRETIPEPSSLALLGSGLVGLGLLARRRKNSN